MMKTDSKMSVPYTKQKRQNKANGRFRPSTPTASFLAVPSEAATPSFATWPTLASNKQVFQFQERVSNVRCPCSNQITIGTSNQTGETETSQLFLSRRLSRDLVVASASNHNTKSFSKMLNVQRHICSQVVHVLPCKKHPSFIFLRPYPTSSFSMAGSMCTNDEICKVSHAWGVLIIAQRHYSAAKKMDRTEKNRATHAGHAKSTSTNGFEPKPAQ